MNTALEAQLRCTYPAIFANWDKPLSESVMSFGLQCGDGWFGIIDALCRSLQALTDEAGAPQAVADEVKQKFGTLRFRTDDELDDRQAGLIRQAEAQSARTCEQCGLPGQLLTMTPRKVATRCAVHADV